MHLNLVEDGEHSNRVNGSYEGTKEESLKKAKPLLALEGHFERSGLADPPQCDAWTSKCDFTENIDKGHHEMT